VATKGATASRTIRVEKANRKAADVAQIIADVQASGASSLRQIAAALNDRGIPAARGGEWTAIQVKRVVDRSL
jgi:histidinol dehydrogenase